MAVTNRNYFARYWLRRQPSHSVTTVPSVRAFLLLFRQENQAHRRQTSQPRTPKAERETCKGINTDWISLPFPGNRANRDDSRTFVGPVCRNWPLSSRNSEIPPFDPGDESSEYPFILISESHDHQCVQTGLGESVNESKLDL
jgi:hypothetical protein